MSSQSSGVFMVTTLLLGLSSILTMTADSQPVCKACGQQMQYANERGYYTCHNPDCIANSRLQGAHISPPGFSCRMENLIGSMALADAGPASANPFVTPPIKTPHVFLSRNCGRFQQEAGATPPQAAAAQPQPYVRIGSNVRIHSGFTSREACVVSAADQQLIESIKQQIEELFVEMEINKSPEQGLSAMHEWIDDFSMAMESFAEQHASDQAHPSLDTFISEHFFSLRIYSRVGKYRQTAVPVIAAVMESIQDGNTIALQLEMQNTDGIVMILNPESPDHEASVNITLSLFNYDLVIAQKKLELLLLGIWQILNTGSLGRSTKILAMHIARPRKLSLKTTQE